MEHLTLKLRMKFGHIPIIHGTFNLIVLHVIMCRLHTKRNWIYSLVM